MSRHGMSRYAVYEALRFVAACIGAGGACGAAVAGLRALLEP